MGRSSGGSGRSGGGFGGGRSSGGFSGGGRSSGGGFNRGPGGPGGPGGRPGPGPRPPHHHHHGPFWGGGFWGRPGCGCGGGIIALLVIFLLFFLLSGTLGCVSCASCLSCSGSGYIASDYTDSSVTQSTTEREPLEGVVSKTDWYEDQLGWISNEKVLEEGLEDFYKATGVQPFVLLVEYSDTYWSDGSLDYTAVNDYLDSYYEEHFEDEGHFIFAYFACENDSSDEMEGEFRYLSGYSVDTIMDSEAISIFWGYFEENYYNTSLSIEEMFSNTFTQTANNIMQTSDGSSSSSTVPMVLTIVILVILVLVIVYAVVSNKKNNGGNGKKPDDVIIDNNNN